MQKEISERAYRLYVKMRCDLESLTNCGLLEHDPGYGYLIGGERHAI